jgi:hypothetical protein
MGTSWTTLQTTQRRPSTEALAARVRAIYADHGELGVRAIQANIWNYSRFKYRFVRPKPSFSRSERAWRAEVRKWSGGQDALVISNPALSSRGVNYPKYVHLAGKSRSDLLMREVHAYSATTLTPLIARAITLAFVDEYARQPATTTTTRLGG